MGDAGLDRRYLLSSRWRNSPDIYASPETHTRGCQVPSLVWFCLQCVSEYPDQIQLPTRLRYQPLTQPPSNTFSLFDKFLRSALQKDANDEVSDTGSDDSDIDFSTIDPRMWATVVQIFDHIHPQLRSYTISLNDELLPLLQGIQSTESFSLITRLELPGCPALTDESIVELRFLHTLAALDASNTKISADGIFALSRILQTNGPTESTRQLRGPWGLRILRLKHCRKVGSQIYQYLPNFPLLSVVDLRGTSCRPQILSDETLFSPSKNRSLFSSNLALSLEALQQCQKDVQIFSAPEQFQCSLRVKNLCHPLITRAIAAQECARHEPSKKYDGREPDHSEHREWYDYELGDEGVFDDEGSGEGSGSSDLGGISSEEWEEDPGIEELRTAWTLLPNGAGNPLNPRHDTSRGLSLEPRPTKRQRMSSEANGISCVEPESDPDSHRAGSQPGPDATRFDSGSSDTSSDRSSDLYFPAKPSMHTITWQMPQIVANQRNLHWYDADWQRKYTYVPMSLAKGKFDDELMLYRPPRPWCFLQRQLELIEARELKQAESRATRNAPTLIAPNRKKASEAQQRLHSMASFAVRRRQTDDLQTKHDTVCTYSRNPFSRRYAGPISMNDGMIDKGPGPSVPRSLKPISALRIPEFTQELLQEAARNEETAQHLSGYEQSTETSASHTVKATAAPAKSRTRGPLAPPSGANSGGNFSPSTDLEGERPKRRGMRVSDALPQATMSTNLPKSAWSKKGAGKRNANQPSFNWAAWASKKS